MNLECRICHSHGSHPSYRARERMFGWPDEFDYFCCGGCGCLQIAQVPADLGRFYPPNYYSFHAQPRPQRGLKSWLAGRRDCSAATGTGFLGTALRKLTEARPEVLSLGIVPARKEMRILDVGCGRGELLSILHRAAVGELAGIDPYLAGDVEVVPGLWVRKLALEQISGEYDLIMLHHVFEHVETGLELLAAARARLSAQGRILLRFPTPESDAWEQYREKWVQLDAPRHLFLHTRRSLGILAGQAGLVVERSWCDSGGFQFWASELYQKGLSLMDERGEMRNPQQYFTSSQMRNYSEQAEKANAANRGDQLAMVLSGAQKVAARP